MTEPKKPYTRPVLAEVAARELEVRKDASGLVLCCGIYWSVSSETDWHVGITDKCGASFDGRCGKCEKPLPKPGAVPA